MKHCKKCNTTKDLKEFNKRKEKVQPWCRSCISIYHKHRRKQDRKSMLKRQYELEAVRKSQIEQKVIDYLKKNPCVQCGENDILVLDFDHLNQNEKEFNVAKAIWSIYSWKRIEREIAKCQILCANCHRKKTAHQLKTWKLKYIG